MSMFYELALGASFVSMFYGLALGASFVSMFCEHVL